MLPVEIKGNIFWVGIIDWDLRDFHGYQTEKGSTYNAYLIKAEKNVLIDTVKADFTDEFINGLKNIIDPTRIDYIVCNHAEMDHTGALPEIMQLVQPEKLICSKSCEEALRAHFHDCDGWPFEIVKEGQAIDIGGKSLRFYGSAMIHWPESMTTYIPEDKVLFSNDIFGQHYATGERFDDEVNPGELYHQAAKYFANIFYPLAAATRKFIGRLEKNELAIDMIAPDHGLIWRKDVTGIIDKYKYWTAGEYEKKAVIVYDTMWESTAMMARAIHDGLNGEGVAAGLYDLRYNHRSDIITEILDARAVLVGCSILNSGILPKMADFLSYMGGLRPANKIGTSFGSYGWKNVITKLLNEKLEEMKIELIDDGLTVQYVPSENDQKNCIEFGRKVRQKILSD